MTRKTPAERSREYRERQRERKRAAEEPLTAGLVELLREGKITESEARAALRKRRAIEARDAERRAKREAEHAAWLEREEETRRMGMEWARFVLAHSPMSRQNVMSGAQQLRETVRELEESSGCKVGCGHQPLTDDEREHLIKLMGEAEDGLDREQAELVLDWAPYLVCELPRGKSLHYEVDATTT
jgi:hypothetical protein